MISLITIVIIIAALLSSFLLGGSIIWGILAALLAAVLLVVQFLLPKKPNLKPLPITAASILVLVLVFVISLTAGMKTGKDGYIAYDTSMVKADNLLQKQEYYKAIEVLDQLEKAYGGNDRIYIMKAQAAIGNSDFPVAGQYLSSISNKRAEYYYTQLGQFYYKQGDYKNVQNCYIEAARTYPLWTEAQLMAGAQSVNNKDYSLAEYYLLRAAEQMPYDPRPLYYLGVVSYESGDTQEAETYFSDAVRLGIDGELAGYTAWYQQELGGEVK
ncbi:MAG: hypothetical protein HGA22_13120 [Clostridiales bacterium]|nr:hypothetical protein [Clostridiales bacterium]